MYDRYVHADCYVTVSIIFDDPVIAIGMHDLHSHIISTIRRVINANMSCLLVNVFKTLLILNCLQCP